eukprot:3086470-Alexandrium_andersonii.AAC.1
MEHGIAPAVVASSEGPLWAGSDSSEYVWGGRLTQLLGGEASPEVHTVSVVGFVLRGPDPEPHEEP